MGLGIVRLYQGQTREWSERIEAPDATNNRAEMLAIIRGLTRIQPRGRSQYHVLVFSDSEWAVRILRGEWKANVNLDLVNEAQALLCSYGKAEMCWIRGHAGNHYNERADRLAQGAAGERCR